MFSGIILSAIGVCSVLWTPFEILMNERLKMRPGKVFLFKEQICKKKIVYLIRLCLYLYILIR